MWTSLVFAAAIAAQPSILDVNVGWDGETMGVTALASAPLSSESARAVLTGRSLQIQLAGASLDGPERTFGRASGAPVAARRTADGVELQVPIGNRLDCRGPVRLAAAGSGVAAALRCTRKGAGSGAQSERAALAEQPPKAQPSAPPEALRSLVQLPADPPQAKSAEPLAAPAPPPAPKAPFGNPLPQDLPRAEAPPQSASTWILGLGAVLALGAGGLFAARRRARSPRIVNIVETAPLGPKRSLVIAKVGSDTLLLGASEAGISLLTTVHGDASLEAAVDAVSAGLSPAALEAELERLEPLPAPASGMAAEVSEEPAAEQDHGQASLLDRLLSQKPKPKAPEVSFESLLAESAEDRDLRRKLQAGMNGRVS